MSETKPWVAHGTIVAFDGGGFNVRRCPDPEQLAAFIVEAVNGHAALTSLMEENARLKVALQFYVDAWRFTTNTKRGGLEWKPKDALLDDCGNVARTALATTGGSRC